MTMTAMEPYTYIPGTIALTLFLLPHNMPSETLNLNPEFSIEGKLLRLDKRIFFILVFFPMRLTQQTWGAWTFCILPYLFSHTRLCLVTV